MFFLYGTGANGKSVLLSTISGILGDYHATAAIETFTASAIERHPTDLAGLRGARWSPRPKPKKAAVGPRAGSRR